MVPESITVRYSANPWSNRAEYAAPTNTSPLQQIQAGNTWKSAYYRPRLRHHSLLISNSLLSLYRLTFPVLSWFPTTGTYSAFNNLRRANKNHKADNTWRDAVVITERSDDIFPDWSGNTIVKLVHCQFCQPVIDRRVEGFHLLWSKLITRVGNHFFQWTTVELLWFKIPLPSRYLVLWLTS